MTIIKKWIGDQREKDLGRREPGRMNTAERAKQMVGEWALPSEHACYVVPNLAALLDLLVEARAAVSGIYAASGLEFHEALIERIDKVLEGENG